MQKKIENVYDHTDIQNGSHLVGRHELGHAHVAAHAEGDHEAHACQHGDGEALGEAGALRLDVAVYVAQRRPLGGGKGLRGASAPAERLLIPRLLIELELFILGIAGEDKKSTN